MGQTCGRTLRLGHHTPPSRGGDAAVAGAGGAVMTVRAGGYGDAQTALEPLARVGWAQQDWW